MKKALLLLSSLALTSLAAFAAEPPPAALQLDLALRGAVFGGDKPDPNGPTVLIDVARIGDKWERVWGVASDFNKGFHIGRVESATVGEKSIEMALSLDVSGDAWVPGGRAKYDLKLDRKANGEIEGTYSGTFRGTPVSGRVTGGVKPPQETVAGYIPVQPGEHPRILFRKSDLPALKKRLETPFGKAAFDKMGNSIGLGMKYQLTGDKKYAEQAMESVEKHMADKSGGALAIGRAWGPRVEQVAVTFDLCYDAWPDAFKDKVVNYLNWITYIVFHDQRKLSNTINWNVVSNYAGPIYSGAAFAGLALWGEKGPEPAKPLAPSTSPDIAPAAGYTPPEGVPVVPIEPGKSPSQWLIAGPLPQIIDGDPLGEMGGIEKARPEPGAAFTVDEQEVKFQPVPEVGVRAEGGVAMSKALQTSDSLTLWLYTVLESKEPQLLKLNAPATQSGKPQVVLAGSVLRPGQVVKLEKGLYPMLVALRLSTKWNSFEPKFDLATDADLAESQKAMPAIEAEYQEKLEDWQFDRDRWEELGGASVRNLQTFEKGRRVMYLFCREGVGTGGFQAESGGYSAEAMSGPNRYASAYRQMMGKDISPYCDIACYLPRKMFAYTFGADGKADAQAINGTASVGGGDFAALFPIVPEKYQPAVLWGWNYLAGGDPMKPDLAKIAGEDAVQAFLHYPLDMQPKEPAGVLPLTWEAPDFGYYAFRNGWSGKDDCIAQVFLKAHVIGGWSGPNAATFRLDGLGVPWTVGSYSREVRRYLENVVILPENGEINEGALGRLSYIKTEPDGSGVVSVDLSDLYATQIEPKPGKDGKTARPPAIYERYGNIRHPEALADSGITGMRSFGVDYSGKSGAPCLFVVVDKIDGGKSKEWLWQLPGGGMKKSKNGKDTGVEDVKTSANGFTMSRGGATLQGTFVSPGKVSVVAGSKPVVLTISHGSQAGVKKDIEIRAIFASGEDKTDGHFFFVATLQKGPAPEVKVQGRGLDAKVTVGGQTVSFDGEKIVFGK